MPLQGPFIPIKVCWLLYMVRATLKPIYSGMLMPHHNGTIHIIVLFVTLKLSYCVQTLETNKDVFVEKE